jgi:pimeloyl-ACP methyl ester carboxylesterase
MTPPRSIVIDSWLPFAPGLHVAMRVQGEGDPLLLINGMTRPLQSWEPFTRELPGRTVVSFDAPGVGGSPTPILPLSITGLAALAVAVLDAAGLYDADVLGFSHGGAVAQQLVSDVPDRVRRLILVSTSCGVGATPGRNRDALAGFGPPAGANAWPRPDVLGLLWHSLAYSSWSSIPLLGAIRAPTLVACGTRDRVVPTVNSRVLAGRIPGATLVMLPGGHDLLRPGPARELARIVEDFLRAKLATERERVPTPSG